MRQCPECRTTYTDDSLKFCLSDGKPLITFPDEEPTVIRKRDASQAGVSQASDATVVSTTERPQTASSTLWVKIAAVAVILVIAAIGGIGLLGAVFYYNTGGTPTPTPTPTRPTPTPTATPDIEKERLKDEVANVRKQLEDQKRNANTSEDDELGSSITATVDSPKDGFLALRSEPDADHGERLAKIPHGAEVEILRCSNSTVTIGSRSGRWCYIDYDGQTGWVFDAWLEY